MAENRLNNFGKLIGRGLKKRPLQNLVVLLCFVLIGAILFSALFLMGGTVKSLETGISRMGADLLVVPEEDAAQGEAIIIRGEPSTFFFTTVNNSDLEFIQGVDKVSPQIYISSLSASCCSLPVQLIGFDPTHDFTITPWLESGLQRPLGKDEIIVGARISGEPGSELMFYGHTFRIAGRLEATGMGLDTSVFMRTEDAYTMAEESGLKAVQTLAIRRGQTSSFLVRVEKNTDPREVGNLIQAQIPGTRVITQNYLVANVHSHLSKTLNMLYNIAAIMVLISLPLAGSIAFLSARERRRDMGLIIAMGGSKFFVFMLVLTETLILATAGGMTGIALSSVILYAFQDYIALSLEIPFLWPSFAQILAYGVIPLLVTIGIGVIAALYPALKSSSIDPFDEIWGGKQ